ncbi:hypothetical protein MHPYR_180094 [uncultured Mycobacterium sp.]|uniref:Uncharacterized protein n=1 Tax=uncultured Mycobacterium sp. TaxID=171292 RepID=A0A1Y5P954_9MYCO|nr:hypothetical protein MHPYR_180094 [uncultured Mycobacterium sp.]
MSELVTAVGYLVIEAESFGTTGIRDRAKMTRVTARPPHLQGLEIAVRVSVQIPKSTFDAAIADISVVIPEELVVKPEVKVQAGE